MKIKVKLEKGELILSEGKRWKVIGTVKVSQLKKAQEIADSYRYSVADGYPGCKLAGMVAEAIGGTAILPNPPPLPEGAVS